MYSSPDYELKIYKKLLLSCDYCAVLVPWSLLCKVPSNWLVQSRSPSWETYQILRWIMSHIKSSVVI